MNSPELIFASAYGGSVFMEELLEVVAEAVRGVGGRARTHIGTLPPAEPDEVYVIVPHEYLVVTPTDQRPSTEQLRRTIGFCVEHPGTATFETSAAMVDQFGAVIDINADSVTELNRRGHRAHRYVLGYAPRWDSWGGDLDSERDLDVTYLGTAERRRSRLLGKAAAPLSGLSVRLLTPPHEPMTKDRPDFLMGRSKYEHLSRTRAMINLHRESSMALEWVRVLEAICNGCVVVTEPSADIFPLRPGEHLIVSRGPWIGEVTAALLAEGTVEAKVRHEAYRFARQELDMSGSAHLLCDVAADLVARAPLPAMRWQPVHRTDPPLLQEPPLAIDTPSFDPATHPRRATYVTDQPGRFAANLAVSRLYLGQRAADRHCRLATLPFGQPTSRVVDVDVLVVRQGPDPAIAPLLDDLALGSVVPRTVLVNVDGAAGSGGSHYTETAHPLVAGVGWSRNRLLEQSTSPRILVLSADMRCTPDLLARLLDSSADITHCPVVDPIDGLVGALPMEERRLANLPYLGAGYLTRREVIEKLGGWSTNPWAEGLVDHLFWVAAASSVYTAHLIQQPLLSRSAPIPRGRPIDLDPARAWARSLPIRPGDGQSP